MKRKLFKGLLGMAGAGLLVLSSCTTSQVQNGFPNNSQGQGIQNTAAKVLTPNPTGEVIGNGNVRISLLIPKTIPGAAATAALQIRNGAELAMDDFARNSIQLVIKDTQGQAAVAQAAATEAIAEGSSLILGPLFAANVSSAAGMTLPANLVILGFSTDTTVARRGVYLMSFTPQNDTIRMVQHARSMGRRSMTAFLPSNAEGAVREAALRETAGRLGIILNVYKYGQTQESITEAVTQSIAAVQGSDSIYIPAGAKVPELVLGTLLSNRVVLRDKQVFGSGAWENVDKSNSLLFGARYPGRDLRKFSGFATRYQTKYGVAPGVQASVGYDAVILAYALLQKHGVASAFLPENIASPEGFDGINGIFRLSQAGTPERGLAIYQIQNGQTQVVEQPPAGFSRNVVRSNQRRLLQ